MSTASGKKIPRYRCHCCQATGKVGVGFLGYGGTVCPACQGKKYVIEEQVACLLCNGEGKTKGWITSSACLACSGHGWVAPGQKWCRKCEGVGTLGSFMKTTCPACDGKRLVIGRQDPCKLCNTKGKLKSGIFSSRECPACQGASYVVAYQELCGKCEGHLSLIDSCQLCNSRGIVNLVQESCPNCDGLGSEESGGFMGLWKTSEECITCKGQGFELQDAPKEYAPPIITEEDFKNPEPTQPQASSVPHPTSPTSPAPAPAAAVTPFLPGGKRKRSDLAQEAKRMVEGWETDVDYVPWRPIGSNTNHQQPTSGKQEAQPPVVAVIQEEGGDSPPLPSHELLDKLLDETISTQLHHPVPDIGPGSYVPTSPEREDEHRRKRRRF